MNNFLVLAVAVLFAACRSPLEPPARDSDAPLQTSRLEYDLRRKDQGLEVEIPFTYTNETGRTVYVINCNKIAPPSLEKQVDGEWAHAWSASVPRCLSAPIVIWPGQTHADTLALFAGHPSNNVYPKFEVEEVEGIYRLAWHGVVHNYDADRHGFGDPLVLQERISNTVFAQERLAVGVSLGFAVAGARAWNPSCGRGRGRKARRLTSHSRCARLRRACPAGTASRFVNAGTLDAMLCRTQSCA